MRLSTCLHRRCFMCGGGGISPQLFTQIGTAEVCLENADFVLTLFIENPGDHFRIKSVVHQNLKIKVWKLKFYRNQRWSGHLSYRMPSWPNLGWSAGVLFKFLICHRAGWPAPHWLTGQSAQPITQLEKYDSPW